METVVSMDAEGWRVDDLILYGVAHRVLLWLTDLLMRTSYEEEGEAA